MNNSTSAASGAIWLKCLGTAQDRLGRFWLDGRSDLLKEVRFPARTPTLRMGDRVVYYASGWQSLFAAGELASDPELFATPADERWPWRADVRLGLLVPDMELAPHLSRAGIDTFSVRSKSHIRLTPGQYRAAIAGLAEAMRLGHESYAALAD